jgi:hypothetical protein
MLWGGEVWFANAQRHHIIHRRGDVEITPDARGSQSIDRLRNKTPHVY